MARMIVNRGTVTLRNVQLAETHWQKFKGLMFVRSLDPDAGLLIEHCRAIHCCFMRIPIDVVFLSKDGRIVHLIRNMRPWRFSKYVDDAEMVLECRAGTIEKYRWLVGDMLELVPERG